jgi:protocatechuate 3,4-dioxygenase beta subunit
MRRWVPWLLVSALVAGTWLVLRRVEEPVAPVGGLQGEPQAPPEGEAAKAPTLIAAASSGSKTAPPQAAAPSPDAEGWEAWWKEHALENQPVAVLGRVTRGDGTPVAQMSVRAVQVDPSRDATPTRTDAGGRYELRGLGRGPWRIVARGGGWVAAGLSDDPSAPRANDPYLAVVAPGPPVRVDIVVEPAARVVGRVVRPDGTVAPGATIEVLPDMTGRDGGVFARLDGPPDPCETRIAEADGRFTFDGLVPGEAYQLRAHSPEHLPSDPHALVAALGEPLPVELALRTGRWIEVTVVDEEDRPVRDAELRAVHAGSWWQERGAGRRTTPTSGAGVARLGPFEAKRVELLVRADGYVDSSSRRGETGWIVPADESTITIRLPRGLSVAGRVLGPGGAPAPGTQVQAQVRTTSRNGWSISGLQSVQTDDTGSFRIDGLPEGRITLDAFQRDRSPPWVGLLEVDAGALDVVLQLEEDTRHVVLKILGPDGEPIPRALVEYPPMAPQEARNGRFEIESMHLAHWSAEVVVSDARDAQGNPLGLAPARLTIPRGKGGEIEVRLARGSVIAGRVLDEQGNPIPGTLVQAATGVPSRWGREEQPSGIRTGEDGTFRVGPLGDGPHVLTVAPPEPFVAPAPQRVVAGSEDLRIVLRRGVSALVTVLDGDGRPVPGAAVFVQEGGSRAAESVAVDDAADQLLGLLRDAPERHELRTGVTGTVRLPPLDPEQGYSVRVVGPRTGVSLAEVTLEGWRPAATTVRLARSWTVTGLVQDEQGLPMPGAYVQARTESAAERFAVADPEGRFEVRQLEAGAVVLSAKASAGPPVPAGPEVRAKAGDQDVLLVAPGGQTLLVTIEGLPTGECDVEAFLELEQRSTQDWDSILGGRVVDARTVKFRHLEAKRT